ncbi:bacteriohemerythrin [Geobacter grbiciae]|uniref:bacteriohemerythrin n=1 Tax=Geobacter grbiciae TaxID=155042 RepID=UPI001C01ECA7|nr:bacteriohemerythrin [Geobacter grbiciae]MBT1075138.1 hemerythrin family protein [Geobacter grbiciae]
MWTDDLAVGIDDIDSQHKALFEQLDKLLDACVAGGEREEVVTMLCFLDQYVVAHFSAEEKLQQEYGYPGYEKHRAEHEEFMRRINRFVEEVAAAAPTRDFVLRVNQTLIDWLKFHILAVDKEMSEFLLKKMRCNPI